MNRRTLLLAGLLGTTAIIPAGGPAGADTAVTVINVSAWNCPYCVQWRNTYKAKWLASPAFRKVRYVEIESPAIKTAYREQYWPEDLWPVIKQTSGSGTPRFLIVKDGKVVSNRFGVSAWLGTLDDLNKVIA